MDEDGILRSGATARRHSHPGWLGWTLKDGCGWWQLEEGDRTGRASQGKERPRHTLRMARVPCLRQPRVEQHAIQLGTNRRLLSTAHILLSSCVFAASARPPHTSVVMQLRVRRPVWSPTGPARRAASGARRPAVHSERTNRTRNGRMVQTAVRRGGSRFYATRRSLRLRTEKRVDPLEEACRRTSRSTHAVFER